MMNYPHPLGSTSVLQSVLMVTFLRQKPQEGLSLNNVYFFFSVIISQNTLYLFSLPIT